MRLLIYNLLYIYTCTNIEDSRTNRAITLRIIEIIANYPNYRIYSKLYIV